MSAAWSQRRQARKALYAIPDMSYDAPEGPGYQPQCNKIHTSKLGSQALPAAYSSRDSSKPCCTRLAVHSCSCKRLQCSFRGDGWKHWYQVAFSSVISICNVCRSSATWLTGGQSRLRSLVLTSPGSCSKPLIVLLFRQRCHKTPSRHDMS